MIDCFESFQFKKYENILNIHFETNKQITIFFKVLFIGRLCNNN